MKPVWRWVDQNLKDQEVTHADLPDGSATVRYLSGNVGDGADSLERGCAATPARCGAPRDRSDDPSDGTPASCGRGATDRAGAARGGPRPAAGFPRAIGACRATGLRADAAGCTCAAGDGTHARQHRAGTALSALDTAGDGVDHCGRHGAANPDSESGPKP
jgi:hypothetical protein